ncbi:hypothetical protein, partial [Aeromonas hydrophila]|uniref:hypothetical protein n=1 Tax=Aeromonas hydrophila TaxID=644 RepID=UPI003F6687A6
GDPLRALLGLAAGNCIDAGVDGVAGGSCGMCIGVGYIVIRKIKGVILVSIQFVFTGVTQLNKKHLSIS